MIQHEFEKDIANFITIHEKIVIELFTQQGGINPQVSLFAYDKNTERFTIAPVVLPDEFYESVANWQDTLAKAVIPGTVDVMRKAGQTVLCVAISTEAWMRGLSIPKADFDKYSMKQLEEMSRANPAMEGIQMIFETEVRSLIRAYEIIRTEGQPPTVKFHDESELPLGRGGGRYQNIFRKNHVSTQN
jgi:hypothetical protein